ncbi:hypothetical protein [Acidithiobacillus albertensis]|uniref:hypothetical protein n=1 Tax=Acidithiobacillus albertensis TaxID=119978 RepID=UPI001C07E009|nr:hypothetical protein [Acidithiobacillus albertensis]MBU2741472.1 hypothetical protein [Acidithiobacillus albertensis]
MLAEVLQNKAQAVETAVDGVSSKSAPRRPRKSVRASTRAKEVESKPVGELSDTVSDTLDVGPVIHPSDALGADSVKKAGNREMLVFSQNETALLRRQEALFRQASAWITRVPEARREGVRQAVIVYARNVRSWQMQTQEQEAAFLAAQDKDQQARARFMLAEKGLTDAAQKKRFGFFGFAFRGRRLQAQACMEQASEHSAAVREALNEQGLAIHRYMRFQSEWRRSMEEMMAFMAEQSGF